MSILNLIIACIILYLFGVLVYFTVEVCKQFSLDNKLKNAKTINEIMRTNNENIRIRLQTEEMQKEKGCYGNRKT